MSFYDHINKGESYTCDKCNVVELIESEYNTNVRDIVDSNDKMRYCNECANYININKYTCIYCCNTWSIRSERDIEPECNNCKGLVVAHG